MPQHYMAVRHRAGTWYLLCRCSRTFCTFRHLASPGHITCRSANQPFLINASGTSGAGCAAQGGCGAAPTASAAPPSVVPDILFERKYTDNRVHDAWACVMRSKGTPVTHSGDAAAGCVFVAVVESRGILSSVKLSLILAKYQNYDCQPGRSGTERVVSRNQAHVTCSGVLTAAT